MLKINVLHRFSIPLDRVLPKTVPRCIVRPGSLPMSPDEDRKIRLPSGVPPQDSGWDAENRPSSGFSPQKRGWKAQRKVREPLGFVRGPSFEALAGVYASAGACILISVRRAYLPHALFYCIRCSGDPHPSATLRVNSAALLRLTWSGVLLRMMWLKHNELRLQRWAFWGTFEDVIS